MPNLSNTIFYHRVSKKGNIWMDQQIQGSTISMCSLVCKRRYRQGIVSLFVSLYSSKLKTPMTLHYLKFYLYKLQNMSLMSFYVKMSQCRWQPPPPPPPTPAGELRQTLTNAHQLSGYPPFRNTQLWSVRSQCTLVIGS